ncbi:hypothetical protein PPOP_3498 [Paenibacillus popilliae ATCC 14706]|uniref:Uncharacterized protein n=1 Tax=Paenibacillus popilliae ATCC 14706 TaxID=1212764 RepID=M9LL72_PAEPP|nr:hypothetical protein PPOP_3498 [Paenibacillus popilliae ATCC 14706]
MSRDTSQGPQRELAIMKALNFGCSEVQGFDPKDDTHAGRTIKKPTPPSQLFPLISRTESQSF